MQSPCDVVDNLLRGRPAERVGVDDHPWSDTLRKWVGQGMPADAEGNAVDAVDHFGFDLAGVGGWIERFARPGVEEIVGETGDWKVVRNGSGASLKWWKNKSGTPEHVDFAMTGREVWERDYRPHLFEHDRERFDVKAAAENLKRRRAKGLYTYFGDVFIWETMRGSMGDYTMYMALADDPDWIHDFNRVYTDLWKRCYAILIEEAGRPDGIRLCEDLGYRDRMFCSPKMLDELIFPYFREIVEFFHGYDLPVILHTCGYVEPALDLIVDAGFDGLNPMEVKAGNDTLKFAERYGDKLAFFGGLDARILESGDRDLMRREIAAFVEGMKSRGARFVFGSDHSISTNVDYDDFRFALDVYREHMMY
jgi:uroporphyrinogen decarboxylase